MSDEVGGDDEVGLIVNGERHEGWKNVTIRTSIEEIASSFSVGFAQQWAEGQEPCPIEEGDEIQLRIGSELVLSGWVDSFDDEGTATSHTLSIAGRSMPLDLVDCSVTDFLPIKGKNILELAQAICKDHKKIKVVLDPPDLDIGDKVDRFKPQVGETKLEALTRLARMRGLLMTSGPGGEFVFTRAATTLEPGAFLRYGDNIKSWSYSSNVSDRFSDYIFKGQVAGSDSTNGAASTHLSQFVVDDQVLRPRPLVVLAEHRGFTADVHRRALWERNTRAGQSERLGIGVVGWRDPSGALWRQNRLVDVSHPVIGIEDAMLISTVQFSRAAEGRSTRLDLVGRDAYDVLEETPKRKRNRKRKRRRRRGGGSRGPVSPLSGTTSNFAERFE